MARKSAAQRMFELKKMIEEYDQDPSAKRLYNWDYDFCTSMLDRLGRKKALTKRMRAKIDALVLEGVKKVPSNPEADEMDRLAEFLINPSTKHALRDFAFKTRKGWSLSVKQKAFAEKLMAEAREVELTGPWVPCENTRKKMALVLELRNCYNSMYWTTHSAGARAMSMLGEYCNGSLPHISEKIWESARYAVRGKLKKIESPRFSLGEKCFLTISGQNEQGTWVTQKHFGIICSKPMIHSGSIAFDVLVDGDCKTYPCSRISKR
tara:strand:- start:2445 stop:3239 length:795 start_codon:yes stop_codon:yes gene_type:complete